MASRNLFQRLEAIHKRLRPCPVEQLGWRRRPELDTAKAEVWQTAEGGLYHSPPGRTPYLPVSTPDAE